MMHVESSSLPNATPAFTSVFGHADPGQSAFALLMDETKQKIASQTGTTLYAAAASSGGDSQKRQHRHLHQNISQNVCESVNSVGIPSENRQEPDSNDFFDSETAEQQFSGHSSASHQHSHAHERKPNTSNHVNYRNNKEIPASAFAAPPGRASVNQSGIAQMHLPEAEFKKLVRVLRNTSLSKRASVFLTLDLKELGEVKLDVTLKGKKVFITAYIADRRAAAALSFAISELKRQLADIDLSLEKFEISKRYKPMASVTTGQNGDVAVSVRTGNR